MADNDQGVAAEFTGLNVQESIQLKTKIINEAKRIKQEQKSNNNGKSTISGGVYAGPSGKVISGDYKKSIENKSKE